MMQVYDFLLSFPDEVNLIWPSRWNLIKVLFFLTRYLPFLDISLVLFCTWHATRNLFCLRLTRLELRSNEAWH